MGHDRFERVTFAAPGSAQSQKPSLPKQPGSVIHLPRIAPVAQLDRALPSEGKGHTFESCRARQNSHFHYLNAEKRRRSPPELRSIGEREVAGGQKSVEAAAFGGGKVRISSGLMTCFDSRQNSNIHRWMTVIGPIADSPNVRSSAVQHRIAKAASTSEGTLNRGLFCCHLESGFGIDTHSECRDRSAQWSCD